jgi:hypothetical protein
VGEESTASSLILAAVIFQVLFIIFNVVVTILLFLGITPILLDPHLSGFFSWILWASIVPAIISSFLGVACLLLWLRWRQEPSNHQTGLIITGIFALIFCGIIPGILAIVAGVMKPQVAKPYTHLPPMLPQPMESLCCPYCGARAFAGALYCWKCGAALEM